MPFAPTRRMPIEIIRLPEGHRAAPDQHWIRITETAGGAMLTGNIPVPDVTRMVWGHYGSAAEAEAAGLAYAQEQGCGVVWVEHG